MENIKHEKISYLNKKNENNHFIKKNNNEHNNKNYNNILFKIGSFIIFIIEIIFELLIICINCLGFYFYYKSLDGCHGTQVECLEVLRPNYFYQLGYFCLFSSIITSVIIFLC